MKKLILTFTMIAFTGIAISQGTMDGQPIAATDNEAEFYAAAGLSIGNSGGSDFASTSYPSIEFGMMKGQWAIGLVGGRSSNDYSHADVASNYWWSIKNAVYFPVPNSDIDLYALFAVGNYVSTKTVFIEYGGGFSYMPTDHLGVFIQASNWDNYWYITPGISYSF
jgi:hypothetical protein